MTNAGTGRQAEAAAVEYLRGRGFAIVAQNWRTRMCEIDIIAQKGRVVYFYEVKYRRTSGQGTGLDYITPKKLLQMRFAAESWVHFSGWKGEYQLSAIEVSGSEFQIGGVVQDLL